MVNKRTAILFLLLAAFMPILGADEPQLICYTDSILMNKLVADIHEDIKKISPDYSWLTRYSDKCFLDNSIHFISKQQIYKEGPQMPEQLSVYAIRLNDQMAGKPLNCMADETACSFRDLGFRLGATIVIQGENREELYETLRTIILKRCGELHKTREKQKEIEKKVELLRSFIIPAKNTSKPDIEAVYGDGISFDAGRYPNPPQGSTGRYYILLSPENKNQEFRAILNVIYKNDKVWKAGISHYCILNSRPIYAPGTIEYQKKMLELEAEKHKILLDLDEINSKFQKKLQDASWNAK